MKNTQLDLAVFLLVITILAASRCGADEPGTLFPVSSPTTMSDDELRKEFLRHTHTHGHRDMDARLERLEERLNEMTEVLNAIMRIVVADSKTIEMMTRRRVPRPSAPSTGTTTATTGTTNEPPRR